MNVISSSISLFFLRKLSWSNYNFSYWQSALAVMFMVVIVGFDKNLRLPTIVGHSDTTVWLVMLIVIIIPIVWAAIGINLIALRWWLKRGQRWDGRGRLFNLLTASSLIASVLQAGLKALGVSHLILPICVFVYVLWVQVNALSLVIPKASIGYLITGTIISETLPLLFIWGLYWLLCI